MMIRYLSMESVEVEADVVKVEGEDHMEDMGTMVAKHRKLIHMVNDDLKEIFLGVELFRKIGDTNVKLNMAVKHPVVEGSNSMAVSLMIVRILTLMMSQKFRGVELTTKGSIGLRSNF